MEKADRKTYGLQLAPNMLVGIEGVQIYGGDMLGGKSSSVFVVSFPR
jgi:hypothetical protein